MWGRATLAMEVSRTSMNVARVTVECDRPRVVVGLPDGGLSPPVRPWLRLPYQSPDMISGD